MAIWLSLERTFLNIISWTNLKVLLMLLVVFPFLWKAVSNMNYAFRFPGLFTALSFGVYSSQATATIYVDGTMGGGRQGAILWYFYVLWMVANVLYWCGWIAKRDAIAAKAEKADQLVGKYLLHYSTRQEYFWRQQCCLETYRVPPATGLTVCGKTAGHRPTVPAGKIG